MKAEKPKKQAKAPKAPAADLDALRKPVEEARAVFTAAEVEANTLESQARDIRIQAKAAFQEVLAPYREACRKAGVACEFGGTKAPSVAPRVRFLVEKEKGGLKVMVAGKPETEQLIPLATLKESIGKAAFAYCESQIGPASEQGMKWAGLSNRLRAALAEK